MEASSLPLRQRLRQAPTRPEPLRQRGCWQRFSGRRTIYYSAGGMKGVSTNGADCTATYTGDATDLLVPVCAFDTTTAEAANFIIVMPASWDEGTVTAIFHWTNTAGASAQTVEWDMFVRFARGQ